MKRLYLVEPVVAIYAFVSFLGYPLVSQYVYRRLWLQITNSSYPALDTSSRCSNSSISTNHTSSQMEEVQSAASLFSTLTDLCTTVPGLAATLVLVARGDRHGRKTAIVLPLLGSLVYCLSFVAVVVFELNLYVLVAASLVSSLSGGIGAVLGGCFAYVADLQRDGRRRTLRMAGLDATLGLLSGAASVSSGHFLRAAGFAWPFAAAAAFQLLNLIYAAFFLEESRPPPAEGGGGGSVRELALAIYRLFALGSRRRRGLLALLLCALCSFSFVYFGGLSVTTLYELNAPLCWSEVLVGYGSALSSAVFAASFLGVFLFSRCLPELGVVLIGMLSVCAGLLTTAFVRTTLLMFLVRIPMLLAIMPFPVMRSMMSKVVSKAEQGALFACVASIDNLTGTVASAAFNSIYAKTVGWFPGFTFLLAGGLCLIPIGLLGVLWFLRLQDVDETESLLAEEGTPDPEHTPQA